MTGLPSSGPAPTVREVIDGMADGVMVAGADGRVLLVNTVAHRLLGVGVPDVPPAEYPAVYGLFLPDMVTAYPAEQLPLARAVRGESVPEAEVFVRSRVAPGGMWLRVSSTPIRGDDGAVRGAVAVLRDVTAEREGRVRSEWFSNVVQQTADAVIITDPRGRIQYVNPAFEATTGYSPAEVLGGTPSVLKSGAHDAGFYRRMWATLADGRVFRETITNRRKNGDLFLFEQTITPIKSPDGRITHLVSVARDVTEVRKAARREGTLQLARAIQQKLFPADPPAVPGFDIAGGAYVADEIGGDYFDFVQLPGGPIGLVIGDVSGHGFDSALLMAETRAVLRSTAQASGEPGAILTLVNRVLSADMDQNRFTTMLVARLDTPGGTLSYASAGHTPGYILDRAGTVKAELTSTGLPLGPFADAEFGTRSGLALDPGDTLLLITDGIVESEAPDGRFFEEEATLETVRACLHEPAAVIVRTLYEAARAFGQGGPQNDDMTVVVCKAAAVS
jgi:phosphoserine phosphatase RsbU/P